MSHVVASSPIIGVSLSEPHTSVTALRTRVCMYGSMDHTYAFEYFTKIDIVKHVKGYCHSAVLGTRSEDN